MSHRPFEVFAHERAFREHAGQQEREEYGEPAAGLGASRVKTDWFISSATTV